MPVIACHPVPAHRSEGMKDVQDERHQERVESVKFRIMSDLAGGLEWGQNLVNDGGKLLSGRFDSGTSLPAGARARCVSKPCEEQRQKAQLSETMKAKSIKSAIRAKINDWLSTIEDESVRKLASDNTIVTGGCIVSFLTKERINDYDVYFRNKETARAVAEYYVGKFKQNPPPKFKDSDHQVDIWVEDKSDHLRVVVKSQGIASEAGSDDYQYFEAQPDEQGEEFVENVTANLSAADEIPASAIEGKDRKGKYRPIFLSGNAITLSGHVQLVLRFIGEPEQIHTYYDFAHCTCYWKSWDGELVLPQAALEAIITKELRYVGSKYPLCSVIRIRKFTARGWTINAGQILKMVMQLQDLNLHDVNVLEDQLTGVDAAYFMQVISRLKAEQERTGTVGEPIDSTYLVSIIDKLF